MEMGFFGIFDVDNKQNFDSRLDNYIAALFHSYKYVKGT